MAARIKANFSRDTNYFVCTLGEAAAHNANDPHRFTTVNDFVDYQSNRIPNLPAVAFPVPSQNHQAVEEWGDEIFSVFDVYHEVLTGLTTYKHSVNCVNGPFIMRRHWLTLFRGSTRAMEKHQMGVP